MGDFSSEPTYATRQKKYAFRVKRQVMWQFIVALILLISCVAVSSFVQSPAVHFVVGIIVLSIIVFILYKSYQLIENTRSAVATVDREAGVFRDSTAKTFNGQWNINNQMSASNAVALKLINDNSTHLNSNQSVIVKQIEGDYGRLQIGINSLDNNVNNRISGLSSDVNRGLSTLTTESMKAMTNLDKKWGSSLQTSMLSLSNLTVIGLDKQAKATLALQTAINSGMSSQTASTNNLSLRLTNELNRQNDVAKNLDQVLSGKINMVSQNLDTRANALTTNINLAKSQLSDQIVSNVKMLSSSNAVLNKKIVDQNVALMAKIQDLDRMHSAKLVDLNKMSLSKISDLDKAHMAKISDLDKAHLAKLSAATVNQTNKLAAAQSANSIKFKQIGDEWNSRLAKESAALSSKIANEIGRMSGLVTGNSSQSTSAVSNLSGKLDAIDRDLKAYKNNNNTSVNSVSSTLNNRYKDLDTRAQMTTSGLNNVTKAHNDLAALFGSASKDLGVLKNDFSTYTSVTTPLMKRSASVTSLTIGDAVIDSVGNNLRICIKGNCTSIPINGEAQVSANVNVAPTSIVNTTVDTSGVSRPSALTNTTGLPIVPTPSASVPTPPATTISSTIKV
jgi:hypothetical protein